MPYWPKPVAPVCIYYDIQAAIDRAGSMMYNGKYRYIRRRHNTVRKLLSSGIITVDYVKSKHNVSNPLTKGLSRERVGRTSKEMGLRPRTSQHGDSEIVFRNSAVLKRRDAALQRNDTLIHEMHLILDSLEEDMMEEMTGLQMPMPSRTPLTLRHTMLGIIGSKNDFLLLYVKSMRSEAQDLASRAKELQIKAIRSRGGGKGDIQREKSEAAQGITLISS
ncbi:hypothetical protein BC332_21081 [Capsicum chinense]|nr:hypothetical protein BC332_21081 [Capsicum chinense]